MLDARRRQYLEAMGIDVWVRREPAAPESVSEPSEAPAESATEAFRTAAPVRRAAEPAAEKIRVAAPVTEATESAIAPTPPPDSEKGPARRPAAPEQPAPEPSDTPGAEAPPDWLFESEPALPAEWLAEPEASDEPPLPAPESAPALDWAGLRSAVAECHRCPELVDNRTRTVFGVGHQNADWLIIGEAPGGDEDRQGEPFVGRAGQLLNNMLTAIGLARKQVYITNVLKCRPPDNRDPRPGEAESCRPFLQRQIELIQPRIILVVGGIAAQNLLGSDQPLERLRGTVHRHGAAGTPVVVTYHPAYLLRSPQDKRKAWADLRLALQTAGTGAGDEGE